MIKPAMHKHVRNGLPELKRGIHIKMKCHQISKKKGLKYWRQKENPIDDQ